MNAPLLLQEKARTSCTFIHQLMPDVTIVVSSIFDRPSTKSIIAETKEESYR